MKKILLKWFTLCVVLLCSANSVYGGLFDKGTSTYKVQTEDKTKGVVFATEQDNITPTEGDYRISFEKTQTGSNKNHKVTMYALAKEGFYFDKWQAIKECSPGVRNLGEETDNPRTITLYVVSKAHTLGEYTALFQPVHVKGVEPETYSIKTTGLKASSTCDVKFNVNKATSDRDYEVSLKPKQGGKAFAIESTKYDGTIVTITVRYTDHNCAGEEQATLTLTSKGDNSSAEATIVANSNLTPTFEIDKTLTFGSNDAPVYVGDRQQKAIVPYSKNDVASQPAPASQGGTGTVWNASISGTDASAFSVEEHPADGICSVTFVPTEEKTYSATLTLTVQYTDAYGNTISSEYHMVALSGVAKTATVSKIEFTPSSYVFPDMRVADADATQVIRVSKQNVSNVVYSWTPEFAGIFQYDASVEGQVTISAKPAAPGTYSTTLVATGTNTLAGHTSEKTTTNLLISVNIGLQKPILSSWCVSDSIYLKWNTIQFAETYTIYEINGTTKTPVTPNRRVENRKEIIAVFASSATKTYQVEAKGTYNGEEYTVWTDAVTQKVGNLTATSVPYWNLYTGTVCTSVGGFSGTIIKKTRVDLSHVFDKNGKALFDELYVFGETVSSDGTASIKAATADAVGTAVTPCYVFTKATDGISYDYQKTPIVNVCTATKQLPRNWTIKDGSQKKLYFTGWCPFGSNGQDQNDEGIIYIKGAAGTSVDIYLEDCYLYSRCHTKYGNNLNKEDKNMAYYTLNIFSPSCSQGSGSAIVVECTTNNNTTNPFKVNVHSRGDNVLKSTMGCAVALGGNRCGQYSSSIYVRPEKENSKTILSFDDKWPIDIDNMQEYERTNGYIRLQKRGDNSPSIDYGTKYGEVNFNGGRIELANSKSASPHYNNTLAIYYRTGNSDIVNLGLGMGGDGVEGVVNFNDGTIFASPIKPMPGQENIYGELDKNGNSKMLRCPEHTYIKGGSHSSEIRACSSVTSIGSSPTDGVRPLVRLDYKVEEQYIDNSSHLALPGFFPEEVECKGCGDGGSDIILNLRDYYTENAAAYPNGFYGMESLCPDDSNYVHLWVPGVGKKAFDIVPWVPCMPHIHADMLNVPIDVGGDQTVDVSKDRQVQHLLYAKLDSYMIRILRNKYKAPVLKPGSSSEYMEVEIDDPGKDDLYYSVNNTTSYTIYDDFYYIISINADNWMAFCPPFDVSEVYVIESYPEQEFIKMDKGTAIQRQAKYNLDFASIVGGNIALNQKTNRNMSFDSYYEDFLRYAYYRDTQPNAQVYPEPATGYPKYVPKEYRENYVGMRSLDYFRTGNWNANYFLYQSEKQNWLYKDGKFETDWIKPQAKKKIIGEKERDVIMEAGSIYAVMFPSGIVDEAKWDYWTGKLIILKGYGPQTIQGTEAWSTIVQPYNEDGGSLRGNATFSKLEVPNTTTLKNAYFQGTGKNEFILDNKNSQMGNLPAGGVFLLANISSAKVPSRVNIRSGLVTYDQETETTTGVPTIAGGRTLIVNSVDGGLTVIPVVAQQVGIYGSAGQLITSDYMTDETTLSLPAGIYMVRGEKETAKVIVR